MPIMPIAKLLALTSLSLLSLPGCGHSCRNMACDTLPSTEVRFKPEIATAGTYRFVIGNQPDCSVPFDPKSSQAVYACNVQWQPVDTGGTIRELILSPLLPSNTAISVYRDDVLLAQGVITTHDEDVELNGEGCGTCRVSLFDLELSQ